MTITVRKEGVKVSDFTGWFSDAEMHALANLVGAHAKPNMIGIEVGSWKGRSSYALARVIQAMDGKLYCVDHFRGIEGTPEWKVEDDTTIFGHFAANMKEQGMWYPTVRTLFMPSADAARIFADGVADMLFVDAAHKYSSVVQDLRLWLPKVKVGGLVCGHDCECRAEDSLYLKLLAKLGEQVKEMEMVVDKELNLGCHAGVVAAVSEVFGQDYQIIAPSVLPIWHTIRR